MVGQVHETGELLAEAEWIDDGEPALAGGQPCRDSQHQRLDHVRGDLLLVRSRANHQRGLIGKGSEGRLPPGFGPEMVEFVVLRHPTRDAGDAEIQLSEPQAGRRHGGEVGGAVRE